MGEILTDGKFKNLNLVVSNKSKLGVCKVNGSEYWPLAYINLCLVRQLAIVARAIEKEECVRKKNIVHV